MKAAVLYKLNAPLVVEDGIEPPPLGRGQVLVRIFYSGLCHSQLMEARGRRGPDRFLPHLLGHEGSGVVLQVGEGVTKVAPSDHVVLGWIRGTGLEAAGARYLKGETIINAGGVTTFNERAVVSENRCVKIPQGVPMDAAVLFGCALPTGAGIVLNTLKPEAGSSMAIFGLGGIGLSALLATRLFAPRCVIAVDVEEAKLALAAKLGATHLVNAASSDPVAAIRELTEGLGVDHAVEAAGSARVIEQAFAAVRKGGGRCVFASHPAAGEMIRLDPHDLISGRRIEGSWGGSSVPDLDVPLFAEHYLHGRLPLDMLMQDRYTLDEINRALEDLEQRRIVRALIAIDPSEHEQA